MGKYKRSIVILIVMLISLNSKVLADTNNIERIYGKDRVETAIKVGEDYFNNLKEKSDVAILAPASNENLVDSLTVAPLAYKLRAPILLNDSKDKLNDKTLESLKRNNIKEVYISTGKGVISDKVEEKLRASNIKVNRLGGNNRYETARNILDTFEKFGGEVNEAFVVSGSGIADALSISSYSARYGMPIILTESKDEISKELVDASSKAKSIYVIGGEGIISNQLVSKLNGERIAGANRYDTNREVIKKLYKDKLSRIYIANGQNEHLVDSLTTSILAGYSNAPIVLNNNSIDINTANIIDSKSDSNTSLIALGGQTIMSDEVVQSFIYNENKDLDAVNGAKENLDLGDLSKVIYDLNLPIKGENDVDIEWKSSDESVISANGKVKRPNTENDVKVILTATLTKGKIKETKEFVANVKTVYIEKNDAIEINSLDEFYDAIKNSLGEFDENLTLDIKNYNNKEYNLEVINDILVANPDINYAYSGAKAGISGYQDSQERIMKITFLYELDKETMIYEKNAVKNKVEEIVTSIIKEDMSDIEKEIAIHDYIVSHAEYDAAGYESGQAAPESHSAYGILINGVGVCDGYAKAIYELLNRVGIECKFVTGNVVNGEGHAWNIVKLDDGEWYNLDVTWDDPTYIYSNNNENHISHEFFNMKSEIFNENHIRNKFEQTFPSCNGIKYLGENLIYNEM